MSATAAIVHIVLCVAIGVAVDSFSEVNWLAASFWTSATLFLTGSFAFFEDALPGGFDNPSGCAPHEWARGWRGLGYWARSLAVCLLLVLAGVLAQSLLRS
jgi:hypothetical protein